MCASSCVKPGAVWKMRRNEWRRRSCIQRGRRLHPWEGDGGRVTGGGACSVADLPSRPEAPGERRPRGARADGRGGLRHITKEGRGRRLERGGVLVMERCKA